MDNIETRVRKLVAARLGVKGCGIRLDSDFHNDPGVESFEVVELVMALEAELGTETADDDAERAETAYQAIDHLREAVPTRLPLDHRLISRSFPAKRCVPPLTRAGGKVRDVLRFDYTRSSNPSQVDPTFFYSLPRQRGSRRRLGSPSLPASHRSTRQGHCAICGARPPFVTEVAMAIRRKTIFQEIDDTRDRMGLIRELGFDERRQARKARTGDERSETEVEAEFFPQRMREADHTSGQPDEDDGYRDSIGMDDSMPKTLIDEGGARSSAEHGGGSSADKRLRVMHGNEISAGHDFDEAELARRDPLDSSSTEER